MFRHLPLTDLSLDPTVNRLAIEDGALRLLRLPPGNPEALVELTPDPSFSGAAGIAVDAAGHLYVADPAGHRIRRRDACTKAVQALAALGGPGSGAAELRTPRGVALGNGRLYVADSGNHRIHVLDARTLRPLAVWGAAHNMPPAPASGAGRLDDPWDVALDETCHLYVVDHGNRRVQRFSGSGEVVPAFWEAVQASGVVPAEPAHVTVARVEAEERVLVADGAGDHIYVYRTDGRHDATTSARWAAVTVHRPGGIRFTGDRLYVADADQRRVFVWNAEGRVMGAAAYEGPVAGLALDGCGGLLVHPGAVATVARLHLDAGRARDGSVVVGRIRTDDDHVRWHRAALAGELPDGAHAQIFTCTTAVNDSPPPPPAPPIAAPQETSTPVGGWRPVPRDVLDALVINDQAAALWVGIVLSGDGRATPALADLRVDYDHETWLGRLPAIYRSEPDRRVFLERILALFETLLDRDTALIDALPRLFDPATVPDTGVPTSWLDWLAGWLDVTLDEAWSDERRRRVVAEAMALHAVRGTADGLRRAVETFTGLAVRVEEPGQLAAPWSLGHVSTLGFTTVLAGAEAQGAVVGTTATLGQSHLIDGAEHGAPIFDETAHGICVQAYAAELAGGTSERLERVVRNETPAHTVAHVCAVAPRLTVGFQARVGIDAIVGALPDLVLDRPRRLGVDTVLAEPPALVALSED